MIPVTSKKRTPEWRRVSGVAAAVALLSAGIASSSGFGAADGSVQPQAADSGQAVPVATSDTIGRPPLLQATALEVLRRSGWDADLWAVLAVSLDQGDTLISLQSERSMIPASNVKLLTAIAALHHLGPDFRFRTFVLRRGTVTDGILDGDLILYGTGDPALSWRFADSQRRGEVVDSLAASVARAGIRRITGAVLGDGTYFSGPKAHPSWEASDLNEWYGAPATALSFNENVASLRVAPATANGSPPLVFTIPSDAPVPVLNLASTVEGRPENSLSMVRSDPDQPVRIEGGIQRGGRDRWRLFTVGEPDRFAASMFAKSLEETGIEVRGGVGRVTRASDSPVTSAAMFMEADSGGVRLRVIAEHRSPPLLELLNVMNRVSHNLYAELTLKTLGRVVSGEGSFTAGAQVLEQFMVNFAGVDPEQVSIADGSGLSRDNRVSPLAFVRTLAYAADAEWWDPLWSTLPEAGVSGLRRMGNSAAADNLRAKTGTMTGVSALSGVVMTVEGERIAFSIVQNGVTSRTHSKRIEDALSVRIASFRRVGQGGTVTLIPSGG